MPKLTVGEGSATMKEYDIITANSIDELIRLVNLAAMKQWEPLGGFESWITSAHSDGLYFEMRTWKFGQAMVREKEK